MDDINSPVPVKPQPPVVNQDISPGQTVQPTPVEPTPPADNPKANPSTPKKKSRAWLWIILIILLLAAGGAVAYMHWHKTTKTAVVVKSSAPVKHDIALIKYGTENNPLNAFYPTDASYYGVAEIQSQVFEGLVSFQNGTQIKPMLASSWTNPNDNTWVFKLKPNIYYHDGDKVTAADVVYTWKQVLKHSQTYGSYETNTIKDVKALNDSTVQITTTQPDAILLNRLAVMYILDSKAPASTPAWELGTGAYTVKAGTPPTANTLDLVAFDKWHGGHVYTKEVDFIFYPDTTKSLKDLQAGKLNLVDAVNAGQITSQLKQSYKYFKTASTGNNVVIFNSENPKYPTANIKIRQALNLAIDPQTVITNAQQTGVPVNQVLPPTIPGYNPNIKTVKQNITQAAALVKSAGYPNGVTVELGIGEPVLAVGQEIAKEVKPAGITIKLDVATDEGTYFNNINSGTYQSFFEGSSSQLIDGTDTLSNYKDAPWYKSSAFDTQLSNAESTFDAAKRLTSLQNAEAILAKDYTTVPLYLEQSNNFSNKGMVFPLGTYDGDLNVYFASVYKQ